MLRVLPALNPILADNNVVCTSCVSVSQHLIFDSRLSCGRCKLSSALPTLHPNKVMGHFTSTQAVAIMVYIFVSAFVAVCVHHSPGALFWESSKLKLYKLEFPKGILIPAQSHTCVFWTPAAINTSMLAAAKSSLTILVKYFNWKHSWGNIWRRNITKIAISIFPPNIL